MGLVMTHRFVSAAASLVFGMAGAMLWARADALAATPPPPPTTTPSATRPTQGVQPLAILPLVADRGKLYATATLNGTITDRMLVDTGSSVTAIATEVATKLGLHPVANKNVDTFT